MLPVLPSKKENTEHFEQKKKRGVTNAPQFDLSGNKVFFISLGCPRNLVDTEVMLGVLLRSGYELSQELHSADFIVINTCGFLEASRKESLDTIQDALKNKKKSAKVIAAGCMVQKHSDLIRQECPEIHYLLGSGDVEGILKAVESKEHGSKVTDARSFLEIGEVPRTISTPQHYAYLKIAEGCRKRCAFCMIPDIKGPLKSKSIEQICKEFTILSNQGVQEIILIAQDLGDWGKDSGFSKSDGLVHLLQNLPKENKDLWIRLLYLYPDEITDNLIDVIKNDSRICRYIDMPIQHVNNDILKAMRRLTTKEDVINTITTLRNKLPDIVIRTSLIVGFPGETELQFQELLSFVQEYPLENIGIFKYSQETGSHAATLPNQVPDEIKEKRLKKLIEVQKKVLKKLLKKKIGQKYDVILEGYHPESNLLMRGRYFGQCPEIDGEIIINDGRKVTSFGKRYKVEITDCTDYDLIGRVL